jgi:hypothetical protein
LGGSQGKAGDVYRLQGRWDIRRHDGDRYEYRNGWYDDTNNNSTWKQKETVV